MNKYYAKFNEQGQRETSIVFGIHFKDEATLQPYILQGFIPITEKEQLLYQTNTYKRSNEGIPIKIETSLAEIKAIKLSAINSWTKAKIIGGFVSTASGDTVTYDSDEATQSTMQTMYAATKSLDFTTHPDYQGVIPVRGYADGSAIKTVFYLTAPQVQKFMDDLALHIGKCKQAGWEKQALVEAASTVEELEQIVL